MTMVNRTVITHAYNRSLGRGFLELEIGAKKEVRVKEKGGKT